MFFITNCPAKGIDCIPCNDIPLIRFGQQGAAIRPVSEGDHYERRDRILHEAALPDAPGLSQSIRHPAQPAGEFSARNLRLTGQHLEKFQSLFFENSLDDEREGQRHDEIMALFEELLKARYSPVY